jgi:hypothetical protein
VCVHARLLAASRVLIHPGCTDNFVENYLADYGYSSNNTVVGNSITDGYLKVYYHANNNFIYGA